MHLNLGIAYYRLDQHDDSIEEFKQEIRIESDMGDAHYFLSLVYLDKGEKELSLDEYKILKKINEELANKLFESIYK